TVGTAWPLRPVPAQDAWSITVRGPTFFRSYGGNLPSSLTRVLSSALGFSPRPPVSVSGTGACHAPRAAFLGSMGSPTSALRPRHLPQRLWDHLLFAWPPPKQANQDVHHLARLPSSVPARFNA